MGVSYNYCSICDECINEENCMSLDQLFECSKLDAKYIFTCACYICNECIKDLYDVSYSYIMENDNLKIEKLKEFDLCCRNGEYKLKCKNCV